MSTVRPKRSPSSKQPTPANGPSQKGKPGGRSNGDEGLSWQEQTVRWLRTAAATGCGVSLGLHIFLLLCLSLYVIQSMDTDEEPINTSFSNMDAEELSFDALHDTKLDMPSADPLQMQLEAAPAVDPSLFMGKGAPVGEGTGGGGGIGFTIPRGAVSKGSFSAWTEPADPKPFQDYLIVIHVQVPARIKTYSEKDLSGFMTGTDGHQTPIGQYTGNKFPKKFYGMFDAEHKLLAIRIPGAKAKVKDTIKVESRALKEKQTLEIVF